MSDTDFVGWAIVEQMGHARFAGHVSSQTVAGAAFIRVDVPAIGDRPAFTKLLSTASLYALTPTDEQSARRAAESFRAVPVQLYVLHRSVPILDSEEDQ